MAADDATPERWLPVPGYEDYEVSSQGHVRSVDRVVVYSDGRHRRYPGDVLRPAVTGKTNVYLHVSLYKDHKRTVRMVHQLVMEAFVGPRPDGQEVCHGPGGALDNWLVNLSYGTRAKNLGPDRVRDGTLIYGEGITGSRLTEQTVTECRRRYVDGETCAVLAAEFGVTAGTMNEAVTGDTWARVPGAIPKGSKAYHRKGAEHPHAKLTPEIVREIRDRGAAGEFQYVIAAEFGVSQSTVWRVIHGHDWTSVT